jgi:FkbM family methyltransferase
MIYSYQDLLKKYNIKPKGIIHIGAHNAEESTVYNRCGTQNVLWIEGNPELIPVIEDIISIYPQNIVHQALLSDTDNQEIKFKIANATMSSSILDLGTHKEQYPSITIEKELVLCTNRFDALTKKNNLNIDIYDFINIDIQGAELLALKGFGELLDKINYIYTEVNVDNVYDGCPLLDEIDEFLLNNGFQRVELSLKYGSWGDAFYVRKEISKDEKEESILESKKLICKYKEDKKKANAIKKSSILYKGLGKIYRKYFKKKITAKIEINLINDLGESNCAFKLLERCQKESKIIIFDIGANMGEYSEMIISHCNKLNSNYELHLFEPQKECVEVLKAKFNSNKNVIINNVAVSNATESITFFVEASGSPMSSIYKREVFTQSEKIEVNAIKLDDYIAQKKINKVHFLKIDVEGHELEVLKSAQKSFDKIENIQFEYGGTYLDAKTTLKEVYLLLRSNYYIGKIEPNNVDFMPYYSSLENYRYSNYLAEKIPKK